MSIIFRGSPPSSDLPGIQQPSLIEMFGEQILECDFCGEKSAAGFWQGIKQISVCRHCAVETLPKIIADATTGPIGSNYQRRNQDLERVQAVYWKACNAAEDSVKRQRERNALMRCPPGRVVEVVDGSDQYEENGHTVE